MVKLKTLNIFKIYSFIIVTSITGTIFNKDAEITRFFQVGDLNYRCVSFANSKNEMFLETAIYPNSTNDRIFFGIKKDGNFYFKDENKTEIPNYLITTLGSYYGSKDNERVDYQNLFIQLTKTDDANIDTDKYDKEYYLSIGSHLSYIELFDLENKKEISQLNSDTFLTVKIDSDIFSFFKQTNLTDKNYYIVAYIGIKDSSTYFYIKRFYLIKDAVAPGSYVIEQKIEISSSNRKIVSCFETEKGRIVCFYQDYSYYFRVIVYDNNFQNMEVNITLDQETLTPGYEIKTIYFKCIHLKREIGVFLFFKSIAIYNPYLSLKNFDQNQVLIIIMV